MPLATVQRPAVDLAISSAAETVDSNSTLLHRLRSGKLYSLPADCQGGLIDIIGNNEALQSNTREPF